MYKEYLASTQYNTLLLSVNTGSVHTHTHTLSRDYNMETLTVGKLHNEHKGYPEKEAVHMALRELNSSLIVTR
jgi:hypothetical protein